MSPAKTVLCVDDDPETVKIRKFLLEHSGYSVVTAASGHDALQLLSQGNPIDLVLLDYLMPGMNGDELAERLRKQYPDLPLIVVSAVGQLPLSLLESTNARVQKGQDPEMLLQTIAAVLSSPEKRPPSEGWTLRKTVLCVEDEKAQLKMRKMLLESAGFHVLEAQSARSAMETFRSSHVDAVVMDYWLSGQNGTALAEEMKMMRPRIPIVMLSGFASLPGEEAIVDSWMRKAEVEPEDLIHELTRLITLRTTPR